ncbi:MAG: hypothetical protein ACKV2O_06090 [Acidimicrobiales bacterium]
MLAFPVSFKGRIIQYVGQLLRPDPAKTDIAVHDYHDPHVAVLVAMARKRHTTYRQLGFTTPTHLPPARPADPTTRSDLKSWFAVTQDDGRAAPDWR